MKIKPFDINLVPVDLAVGAECDGLPYHVLVAKKMSVDTAGQLEEDVPFAMAARTVESMLID